MMFGLRCSPAPLYKPNPGFVLGAVCLPSGNPTRFWPRQASAAVLGLKVKTAPHIYIACVPCQMLYR